MGLLYLLDNFTLGTSGCWLCGISLFRFSYYIFIHVLPLPLLKLQLGHGDAVSLQMFSDAPNYFRAISVVRVLQSAVAQLLA